MESSMKLFLLITMSAATFCSGAFAIDYTIKVSGTLETIRDSNGVLVQRILRPEGSEPPVMTMMWNKYSPANPALDCKSGEYEVDVFRDDATGAEPFYMFR